MNEPTRVLETPGQPDPADGTASNRTGAPLYCDRCGYAMFDDRCKIVCANCGNRLDCSDLNLYFD
jgi:hypothetical protein